MALAWMVLVFRAEWPCVIIEKEEQQTLGTTTHPYRAPVQPISPKDITLVFSCNFCSLRLLWSVTHMTFSMNPWFHFSSCQKNGPYWQKDFGIYYKTVERTDCWEQSENRIGYWSYWGTSIRWKSRSPWDEMHSRPRLHPKCIKFSLD